MRTRGPRYPLGAVTLAAALVGAAVTVGLGIDPRLNPDSLAFEAIARSLLAGHGFAYREAAAPGLLLYAFRSPGYSAFLAIGLWLGGTTAAVALQGAMNGVSAALVGGIARRLAGARAAWTAFALRLLWPAGWFHASQLLSEIVFECATILAVWLTLRCVTRGRLAWAVGAGIALGISVLVRPLGVTCVVAILAWMSIRWRKATLALAASALLVWLPWPIRNAVRLHAFVPLLTMGGLAGWTGVTANPTAVAWRFMGEHPELGELGLDRHFWAAARRIVLEDPARYVFASVKRFSAFVGPLRERGRDLALHRFALLAVLPALLIPAWRPRLTLPAWVWFAEGLMVAAVQVSPRYRFPSEWCVVVGAAIGIEAAFSRWGGRRTASLAAAALVLCIAFTLAVARD